VTSFDTLMNGGGAIARERLGLIWDAAADAVAATHIFLNIFLLVGMIEAI